jgi:hypothetical protein
LSTHGTPTAVAVSTATTTAASGISVLTSTQSVCGSASTSASRTRSRSTPAFAPAPTAIWFPPPRPHDQRDSRSAHPSSTRDAVDAHAVGPQLVQRHTAGVVVADGADQRDVRAGPRRATAALAPLPPPKRSTRGPTTVSPGPAAAARRPRSRR